MNNIRPYGGINFYQAVYALMTWCTGSTNYCFNWMATVCEFNNENAKLFPVVFLCSVQSALTDMYHF